jgi:hypothetical protein
MGTRPCSRCGRPPSTAARAAPEAPWAPIEGADVCPDCQTPDERREIATRILAAIESEIERRRREEIPPDDVEGALIAHALSLREQLDAAGTPGRPRLRVAITAAFLTGHPLAVRIAGYDELQRDLDEALSAPGWRVRGLHADEGTFESGGGFVHALPLVIARRDGPELVAQLRYLLDEQASGNRAQLARMAPGYDIEPGELRIDVYDLGVAVMTAWCDVSAPGDAALPDVARTVKRLVRQRAGADGVSPLVHALQRVASDTTEQYGAAVRAAAPESIRTSWLSGGAGVPDPDRGRLLWLHPVHVLETDETSEGQARELAPAFHDTVELSDAVFAPGVGWSAIVTAPGTTGEATPVELTELHWAYYALYMEMDRGLLAILDHGRWSDSSSLRELEEEADDAFGDYLRVMEARARLDSALSARGGDELAVWQVIADVQRFDAVVDSVERKVEILQRLTQRRAEQAASRRGRRISNILGSLTGLTILTVTIALVGYSVGSKPDLWVRIVAVAAAVALMLLVYWLSYRQRGTRRL